MPMYGASLGNLSVQTNCGSFVSLPHGYSRIKTQPAFVSLIHTLLVKEWSRPM